jgi:hypothetical protein
MVEEQDGRRRGGGEEEERERLGVNLFILTFRYCKIQR